jgi:hypothetical protein
VLLGGGGALYCICAGNWLVDAKASFGTSIRGLGQLNEETKEVENYDYLGTDCVGNPSAGTFASSGSFKVQVESAPVTLVKQVKEQLKDKTMSFNLQEAIKDFKTKHFKEGKSPQVTQEVTADLLAMQRQAVEASVDTSDMDALSDEIFGQAVVEPPAPKKNNEQKAGETTPSASSSNPEQARKLVTRSLQRRK